MASKEQSELLEKVFSNVNSWLNFAEAKHAANIAFVVACLAMMISTETMNCLTCCICVLFVLSGGCSLLSFFPKTAAGGNLLFFERIKNYSEQEYLNQLKQDYFQNNSVIGDGYISDLTEEIVINAKITSRKYKCFRIAMILNFFAFFLLIIYFSISFYFSLKAI